MTSWKKLGILSLLGFSAFAQGQEINLSGFASAHITQKLGGNSTPEYYSDKTNYYNFTKFGLNVGSRIDDKWSIQSQLLVSGKRIDVGAETPQWNMYANWLFASYRPTDNFRMRIGRQLFPAWLVSEYIDVGYMYPWTETPHSVYELSPFKSINGLSADYSFQLNNKSKLTVLVFGGEEQIRIPLAGGGYEDNNYGSVIGSELTLQSSGHKFRLMGANYKLSTVVNDGTNPSADFKNNSVTVVTSGYKYDQNDIVVYAEYGIREGNTSGTEVSSPYLPYDGINSRAFNKRARAGYLTFGHWFNKLLPHLTLSQTNWQTGTVEGTQDLYSLGLNYKLNDNIIFKTNVGYTITNNGPAHMDNEGDATTWVGGLDMIF